MWVMGSHMFRKDIGHHLSIKMIKNMRMYLIDFIDENKILRIFLNE